MNVRDPIQAVPFAILAFWGYHSAQLLTHCALRLSSQSSIQSGPFPVTSELGGKFRGNDILLLPRWAEDKRYQAAMDTYIKEYMDGETQTRDANTDTIIAKTVAMVCLFLGSFTLGILPIKLSQWLKWESNKKSKNFAATLLCFGGGVLICTIFFHLLPEVDENLQELIETGRFPETKINFTEMLMCIGFFVLYFVEECVHLYLHHKEKAKELNTFKRTLSIRRCELDDTSDAHSNSSANLVKADEERGKTFAQQEHGDSHNGHSHIIIEEDSIVKSLRGLLVVLALSVHELFEGLAVGLESSSTNVWYMFAAVSVHKFVIAFCIGVELVTTKTKFVLNVIYVFIFSVVSPLGIGIGIAITVEKQESTALVSVILQGLASGTLIYVVFFEILQKDKSSGLKRYLAVLAGFLVMLLLTVFNNSGQFLCRRKDCITMHHQHHHVEDLDKTYSNLITAKVVSMAVLGIASFFIGIIPIKLTKLVNIKSADKDKNLVISLLLCFGGGVLLFTTFLHLQPEVREGMTNLEAEKKIPTLGAGVPLSELIFCVGFFFVYLIEELAHLVLHKKMDQSAPLHRTLSVKCNKKDSLTIPRVTLNKLEDGNGSYISNSTKELFNSQTNLSSSTTSHNGHSHMHIESSVKNSFRGLLAVLALSFHAVFEGLAVGLENNTQKVWYLFAAIATHKLVIAFCVGVELAVSNVKTVLLIIYIGTFAVVTPLGIGIGIALKEVGESQDDVVSVVLQGMAAGTLLYVVFFEVLARERNNSHSGVWQLVAIIAGFGVMLGLQFVSK
ncbi:hypothetical protein FQR65_LT11606 [Abscondita terminalis]|nr:hypothetical protein FQR65_LT11606 [Abscondita terminalis]